MRKSYIYVITCTIYALIATYALIVKKPNHIKIDQDVTCTVAKNSENYAEYIMMKYGGDGDFNRINAALLRHGYYLERMTVEYIKYTSYGEGSICFGSFLNWDSQVMYMKVDKDLKVLSLGSKL